jgi:hypothetical protein
MVLAIDLALKSARSLAKAISRAGESGIVPAAEGATAPETLRQKDRARKAALESEGSSLHRRSKPRIGEISQVP